MNRLQHAVLSTDEIEAFKNAFDDNPPLRPLQPRFRFTVWIRIGLMVAGFHLISFGTVEPMDPPLILAQSIPAPAPHWRSFEQFPLSVSANPVWPLPDLTQPPLLLQMPSLQVAGKTQKADPVLIRLGDTPPQSDPARSSAPLNTLAASAQTVQSKNSTQTTATTLKTAPSLFSAPKNTDGLGALFNALQQMTKSANTPAHSTNAINGVRDVMGGIRSNTNTSSGFGTSSSFSGFRKG